MRHLSQSGEGAILHQPVRAKFFTKRIHGYFAHIRNADRACES